MATASKITEVLNSFTSSPNGIPGVVFSAIKRDGTLLYEGASGVRGLNHKDQPMTNDTVFWIASCTKLLTAVAALQLVEQGKFSLEDHAEKYVPEIGTIHILTGFEGDKPILQEPKTKITIHQLLSHTAGFTYDFFNALTHKYAQINNIPSFFATKRSTLTIPLSFEPGTKWEYGVSLDWVGLIIEAVTGQSLGAYMNKHLFEPLGIRSTTFATTPEQNARHAHLHSRTPDQHLAEIEPKVASGDDIEVHIGGGGAHSTAADFLSVLHALLNEGVGTNGAKILSKESVDLLFLSQSTASLDFTVETAIPELSNAVPLAIGVPKAWTYGGLKLDVTTPTGRSTGSVWWAGIANCFWWVDRTKGVAGVILTQILPFLDAEVAKCWNECERLVYESL